jgi:hypothetical protein
MVEPKNLGCFDWKEERGGYLEEAQFIGKQSAPYNNKNFVLTEPRLLDVKMMKPVPEKPVKK